MALNSKDTNPKDAVGTKKAPLSTVPTPVLLEIGLAMLEGARKYGRHNYRIAGVRGSVYYDASLRHLMAWWEGQDVDPDSGLSHITKAIAGLCVLRDSMIKGNWVDDRPPAVEGDWIKELNKKAGEIIEKYPNSLPPYTEIGLKKDNIIEKAKQLFPKSEEKIFKVIGLFGDYCFYTASTEQCLWRSLKMEYTKIYHFYPIVFY